MMAGIRGRDTKPELMIRRALHARGFRYRLDVRELPGRPDILLPRHRAAIFVHGCFWHGHDCALFRWPRTREEFWRRKIEGNRVRDAGVEAQLRAAGWRVATVWECAMKGRQKRPFIEIVDQLAGWIYEGDQKINIEGLKIDDPPGAAD